MEMDREEIKKLIDELATQKKVKAQTVEELEDRIKSSARGIIRATRTAFVAGTMDEREVKVTHNVLKSLLEYALAWSEHEAKKYITDIAIEKPDMVELLITGIMAKHKKSKE